MEMAMFELKYNAIECLDTDKIVADLKALRNDGERRIDVTDCNGRVWKMILTYYVHPIIVNIETGEAVTLNQFAARMYDVRR
jgi:hypothetical protein